MADMSIMLGLFLMIPFLFQKQHPDPSPAPESSAAVDPSTLEEPIDVTPDTQEPTINETDVDPTLKP